MKPVRRSLTLIVASVLLALSSSETSLGNTGRSLSENRSPIFQSPLGGGRSPASLNPLLRGDRGLARETQLSLDGSLKRSKGRWRLLGTCRQDSGMNRNLNGMGYGDCNY